MAREILFKAKTEMIVRTYNNGLEDGEWVQGYLRCDCGMWLIYQFEYDRADQVAYEVNPETICQFTGLLDKNGNKIFENDVVRGSHWNEREELHNWKVDWNEKSGLIVFKDSPTSKANLSIHDFYDFGEVEVIGNIFDNKELLGGEDNG